MTSVGESVPLDPSLDRPLPLDELTPALRPAPTARVRAPARVYRSRRRAGPPRGRRSSQRGGPLCQPEDAPRHPGGVAQRGVGLPRAVRARPGDPLLLLPARAPPVYASPMRRVVVSLRRTIPDYLVLHEDDGFYFVECKARSELEKSDRFVRKGSGWSWSAAEEAAAEYGVGYRVFTPETADRFWVRNLRYFSDFVDADCPDPQRATEDCRSCPGGPLDPHSRAAGRYGRRSRDRLVALGQRSDRGRPGARAVLQPGHELGPCVPRADARRAPLAPQYGVASVPARLVLPAS